MKPLHTASGQHARSLRESLTLDLALTLAPPPFRLRASLYVLCILLGIPCLTRGADPSPAPPAPAVPNAATDAEDREFHDPFAKENEAKGKAKVSDPLEPVNRVFFKFNDKLYFWVLKPVAKGYKTVAPEPFRESIQHFFVNVRYPIRVVNNLLQAKFKGAGIETARFLVNSTVGIGGLFDPANDEWNLRPHPEDLDQTLGFYGLPPGAYLDWPLFGPSSVRGTAGMVGDSFLVPWNYIDETPVIFGTRVFDTVNASSLRLGEYERFKEGSFDPYVSLRDAYFENRRSLIEQ
jgi:phospholipid-binding lipoprotein MlaA